MNFRRFSWLPALCLITGTAAAQKPTGDDWTTYGGNQWNQRYSGLNEINASNVAQLVPRGMLQTGIAKLGSFENTPVIVGGMAYVTTPFNTAIAYDLDTGKQLWRYEHKLGTTIYCCGPNNRGVARPRPARVHGNPRRPSGRARTRRRAKSYGTSRSPIRPTATASRTRRWSSTTTSSSACRVASTASAAT